MYESLKRKLENGSAVVGIIGLGYVGLPLALAMAKHFRVLGFDIRAELVQALRRCDPGSCAIRRVELVEALNSRFLPTVDFDLLRECDFIVIAVGTPLKAGRDPDLSQVECAAREIARQLRPGQFIILESTSFPGTTEEVLLPILESRGLLAGVDFGVAYSPERIDPGNNTYRLDNTAKLVGGLDDSSTQLACEFYRHAVETVIPVSHARVAEAAKIIENIFRAVNIALVNELALVMEGLGIDTWEAIRAASTKPFGFMAFYPGPGVGGHCIPLDPYYLSYRARKAGYMPRFIEVSGEVNEYMKFHTVELLRRGLREAGKQPRGSSVAILGFAFKRNVGDTRESPAIRVLEECSREGMRVRVFDPLAKSLATAEGTFLSEPDVETAISGADAAVILVDHDPFMDYDFDHLTRLMSSPAVWVDARFVLAIAPEESISLGIGRAFGRIPTKENRAAMVQAVTAAEFARP